MRQNGNRLEIFMFFLYGQSKTNIIICGYKKNSGKYDRYFVSYKTKDCFCSIPLVIHVINYLRSTVNDRCL